MAGSLQQLPEVWLEFSNEHQSLGQSWTAFTICALAPWHLCWRDRRASVSTLGAATANAQSASRRTVLIAKASAKHFTLASTASSCCQIMAVD